MATVVAKRLNLPEIDKWIHVELRGYLNQEEIPDYRIREEAEGD
jgi:hypothetical protein